MPEFITHVDEFDHVLGVLPREDFFKNPTLYCRTSHLYLFDKVGRLLIQERSHTKQNYPGMYDASVSGTVRAGETYEDTLSREAHEEIGIERLTFSFFLKGVYTDAIHRSHKALYTAIYDGSKITPQKTEIEHIYWLSRKEISNNIQTNSKHFCPPFLEELQDILEKNQLTQIFF